MIVDPNQFVHAPGRMDFSSNNNHGCEAGFEVEMRSFAALLTFEVQHVINSDWRVFAIANYILMC